MLPALLKLRTAQTEYLLKTFVKPEEGMEIGIVQPHKRSAILGGETMAAYATPATEPVNPLDLANRMGIEIRILALAVGADPETLTKSPRNTGHDEQLRIVSDLWKNLIVLVGDEKRAHLFLRCNRPELGNEMPLHYLEQGEPGIVLDLVMAMRELLP